MNPKRQIIGNTSSSERIKCGEDLLKKAQGLEEIAARIPSQEFQEPTPPTPETSSEPSPIQLPTDFNQDDYIYLPTSKIYISKQKDLFGKNWYEQNQKLLSNNQRMPTLPEMWELIFHLKANQDNSELKQIYNEILEQRESWRRENINAKFKIEGNKTYLQTAIGLDNNGEPTYSNWAQITSPITENCFVDISNKANINSDGFPVQESSNTSYTQGQNIYFCKPIDGKIAGFVADSYGAYFSCCWGPDYRDDSLGVRRVVVASTEGASRDSNLGGNEQ